MIDQAQARPMPRFDDMGDAILAHALGKRVEDAYADDGLEGDGTGGDPWAYLLEHGVGRGTIRAAVLRFGFHRLHDAIREAVGGDHPAFDPGLDLVRRGVAGRWAAGDERATDEIVIDVILRATCKREA